MTNHPKFKSIDAQKVAHLELNLPANMHWMVWGYSGIEKNLKAKSKPLVLVIFRSIRENGQTTKTIECRNVSISYAGQLRIGSIWKRISPAKTLPNCECIQEIALKDKVFDIDFDDDGWELASFNPQQSNNQPYPAELYEPLYPNDKNWFLKFKLSSGGFLVVPCVEFFIRFYGRSAKLRNILISYPWEICEDRFYAPPSENEIEISEGWTVCLRKDLVNEDAVFLAHAKYDEHTRKVASEIYNQMLLSFSRFGPKRVFLAVKPWFYGKATIKAKGLEFNDTKSFIALNILGGSEPKGPLIHRSRENEEIKVSKTNQANKESEDSADAWLGMPAPLKVDLPDHANLIDHSEPDHGAQSIEVKDPPFEVLGKKRDVIRVVRIASNPSSSGKIIGAAEASAFSNGDTQGSGKGFGYASISADSVLESQGTLRDMWNAMLHLKTAHPNRIKSLDYFTFASTKRYASSDEPKLVALLPHSHRCKRKNSKWLHLPPDNQPRGVLIARMVVDGMDVHIIELQRKPTKTSRNSRHAKLKNPFPPQTAEAETNIITPSISKPGEEAFIGIIAVPETLEAFEKWLTTFLHDVIERQKIVRGFISKFPGRASTFTHHSTSDQDYLCQRPLKRALKELGFDF